LIKAPADFNLDVVVPTKQVIGNSPLQDITMSGDNFGFGSDNEKDLESTEES